MYRIQMTAAALAVTALTACGTGAQEPQRPLRQTGTFVLTIDPSAGTASFNTVKQGVYQQLVFGEDMSTMTNPVGTIQAVTTNPRLPGVNSCPAGTNCFTVTLTNFTGAPQGGVYMAIDAIFPAPLRSLVAPDAAPVGVPATSFGGRLFGDLAVGASSAPEQLDILIPDNTTYVVTGTFWGDDAFAPPVVPNIVIDELNIGSRDFISLRNTTASAIDLDFLVIDFDDSTAGDLTFNVPSFSLAGGATVNIIESGAVAGEISTGSNIFFSSTRAGTVRVCSGACDTTTGANIIDALQWSGSGAAPAIGGAVTQNGGDVVGITSSTENAQSFQRVATTGANPTFQNSDYAVGAASR